MMTYWAVGTTWGDENEEQLPRFLENSIWQDGYLIDGSEKNLSLLKQVSVGDFFIAKSSFTKEGGNVSCSRIKAIGKVKKINDDYSFQVDWFNQEEKDFSDIWLSATIRRTNNEDVQNYVNQKYQEYIEMNVICENRDILLMAKNLVLTGAPGTGKTYLAVEIANALTGDTEKTPEEKRHTCFVQFHPSYDYTDFVEGLRPIKPDNNGNIGFKLQDGTFKSFCKKALENRNSNFKEAYQSFIKDLAENYSKEKPLELKTYGDKKTFKVYRNSQDNLCLITGESQDVQGSLTAEKIESFITGSPYPYWKGYYLGVIEYLKEKYNLSVSEEPKDQNYVFIIDEINRGDIAKIFGELFFALDPGYRGQKKYSIKTQYSNLIEDGDIYKEGFYIPDNVYIIGTMNDIDRNVESMDFAVRRRFTWKKISPEDTQEIILASLKDDIAEEAKKRMNSLNEVIKAEKQLGENFCIGAAYFKNVEEGENKWEDLWECHLKSLLEEYVRGIPNAKDLMQRFEEAYKLNLQKNSDANS